MSAVPEFIDVTVANGYIHHAAHYRPAQLYWITPVVATYTGKTLCRRGANGVRATTDAHGTPVPFIFGEYQCDRCMARVSVLRKATK